MTVLLVDIVCRRQQYIGKAKFIEYMPAGHSAARVIVGTEHNVIAAINGHNGHIGNTAFLSLPERDYVTFGSLLSQIHLSSVVCNIGALYSSG